ncbi:MAG TPA: purine-binding chemotaxis protein CheW [Actinobacteria bacterium]|nr:purine-binding chemotaxis protein CheW [Actinomycetota bacterium]
MSNKLVVSEADSKKTHENDPLDPHLDSMQYVTFTLSDETYGITVENALEVVRMVKIAKPPNSPNYVAGLINIRGKVAPIVDMRKRLKLGSSVYTLTTPILIVVINGWTVGMIVDRVSEVVSIPRHVVEEPSETFTKSRCISGVAKFDPKLIFLIELEKLFTSGEKQQMQDLIETKLPEKALA